MKMSKIYRAILAMVLTFSLTAPSFATEGEVISTPPVTEDEQVLETPGEEVEPPEDGEQTTEPPETPAAPEVPGGEEQPEPPEIPEIPETSMTPEIPSVPESPDTPETPPAPEDPVTPEAPVVPAPEEPTQPLPWIPVQPPEQAVPPVTQTPPVVQAPVQVPQAESPVIDVVVPDTGAVIINPYGLPVTVDGRETTEQIAGSTMLLENRSNVAVDVSVNAVGTPLGGVVFASQPPAEKSLEKELFLYAEFHATETYGGAADWQSFFSGTPYQLPITLSYSTNQNVMRLEVFGLPYSFGAVRLFGSVSVYPAYPWQAGDGFHLNLAFTFTPVTPEAPVLDAPGGTDVDSSLVLPADPDVIPDWIIPADPAPVITPDPGVEPEPVVTPNPVITPDPVVIPDPVITPEPAVPSEMVPETVPDESAAPVPDTL